MNENTKETITSEEKTVKEETIVDEKKTAKKRKAKKTDTEELEKLNATIAEITDKYLRLNAEFDNYRKRTIKEKAEIIKSGGENVIKNLLPVIDDFDRAMKSVNESNDLDAVKEGLNLIYGKFKDFLTQQGIKEIDAKDKDFDTDLHDAITRFPAPSEELKGKIIDVVEKGYLLNEKVIRFAKVVIGE